MHNTDKLEYNNTNRQVKRQRTDKMFYNNIHDSIYTFADEYYAELREDFVREQQESLADELRDELMDEFEN